MCAIFTPERFQIAEGSRLQGYSRSLVGLMNSAVRHATRAVPSTRAWKSLSSIFDIEYLTFFQWRFIRSPVLWTVDLMFCACFFFLFFSQLTFSDVCKPIFSKLFHMTWLYSKKKRCYADFLKVPPNKNEVRKNPISPNLASNRNILCAVTRNVEGK